MIKNNLPLSELLTYLESELISVFGNVDDVRVNNLSSPENASPDTLDWIGLTAPNPQEKAENSPARAILAHPGVRYSEALIQSQKILILVKNPRVAIAKLGNRFFVEKTEPGIHPSAIIHPRAQLADSVCIGANCVVGECRIGRHTVLEPGVIVHNGVEIGEQVIVHAGAVIGTEGLGCFRDEAGELTKFPHLGGLIIGDKVEIGANCSIAKGSLSNTVIGKGTKINSLCFVAHNCIIGENVLITGSSMLNGSVKIGDNATIYSNVIVGDQKCIGKGAVVGMGAVVTKDIPEYEVWVGNPAGYLRANKGS
ncbi:UDP-3-O-(3-hydroxymyristoyl)glucosamine N-acyltransferase [Candidatus Cloacimonadaceae bacterium]